MRKLTGGQVLLFGKVVKDDEPGSTSILDGMLHSEGIKVFQANGNKGPQNAYEFRLYLIISGTKMSEIIGCSPS